MSSPSLSSSPRRSATLRAPQVVRPSPCVELSLTIRTAWEQVGTGVDSRAPQFVLKPPAAEPEAKK